MRPPLSSASAPSMVDSLPSINFGFEDLRQRMASFTDRFDAFIAEGRKRVLEERNQFRIGVAELQEDQRLRNKEIESLVQKSSTHAQSLNKEAAETAEMNAAIASITAQRDARAQDRDRLRSEIANTKKQISQKVAVQQQHAKDLEAQARFNAPELNFWTNYLCLRIEGAGKVDRLKFVFTHVDERDWQKEAWFELDTQRRDYAIATLRPKLDTDDLETCLARLNANRDLGIFLGGMRELFVKALK
ncbi:MAG: hypothetical protein Q9191_004572 [Dirinaria sp. TL-2023a]